MKRISCDNLFLTDPVDLIPDLYAYSKSSSAIYSTHTMFLVSNVLGGEAGLGALIFLGWLVGVLFIGYFFFLYVRWSARGLFVRLLGRVTCVRIPTT